MVPCLQSEDIVIHDFIMGAHLAADLKYSIDLFAALADNFISITCAGQKQKISRLYSTSFAVNVVVASASLMLSVRL